MYSIYIIYIYKYYNSGTYKKSYDALHFYTKSDLKVQKHNFFVIIT